jgi:hypothetical protein
MAGSCGCTAINFHARRPCACRRTLRGVFLAALSALVIALFSLPLLRSHNVDAKPDAHFLGGALLHRWGMHRYGCTRRYLRLRGGAEVGDAGRGCASGVRARRDEVREVSDGELGLAHDSKRLRLPRTGDVDADHAPKETRVPA